MRMRLFTPRQPPPDKGMTPQERKTDPELSIKHDDLYGRAWECEYEKPLFDTENNNATPSNSPEIPVLSGLSSEETRNLSGTPQECSREIFQ